MKIGLIGTFDVNNFGDCMFPELYSKLLTAALPDVEISYFSPFAHAATILSEKAVKVLPENEETLFRFDCDILILVGGETIGIGHSPGTYNFKRSTYSAFARLWISPILATASEHLNPNYFAAQSVGAIKMSSDKNQLVAQALSGANRVRFRDRFSCSWIKNDDVSFDQDVDPMYLISDLLHESAWIDRARGLLPESFPVADKRNAGGYIAAQMSIGYGENDIEGWSKALNRIYRETGLSIVLLPICHFLHDERLLRRASSFLRNYGVPHFLVSGLINVKDTAAIIGCSGGYIGSSLHGAVTAVSFGRSLGVLGHSMDGKHEGTLASIGIPGLVTTSVHELPNRFLASLELDLPSHQYNAKNMARQSFDALVDDIRTRTGSNRPISQSGTDATKLLLSFERNEQKRFSSHELKRWMLRTIRKTPLAATAYENFRLMRKFRGI
ncbi:polysaccharide pyruvyl transferase WcaK-like protein [Labrenzia sp. EL_208]|nr:polysaccharide pyruvyl transferase WcaK-like protein [Labrenzia sp. EL_132]MBG6233406.1 polysaccharide pyruvyl transferase WcaK-like protein [Labrenzia sp. EL_208]